MIVASRMAFVTRAATLMVVASAVAAAQQPAETPVARLVVEPAQVTVEAGKPAPIKLTAYAANGSVIANAAVRWQGGGRNVTVTETSITGRQAGNFELTAVAAGANGQQVTVVLPVTVKWPALARLEIVPAEGRLYTNTTLANRLRGWHADSSERGGINGNWRSSNAAVATVDRFGNVTGVRAGSATISAELDGVRATRTFTVAANPVARLEITVKEDQFRTGDVVHLTATARSAAGATVADAPVTWTYTYVPDDSIAPNGVPGGAGIVQFGVSPATTRVATP